MYACRRVCREGVRPVSQLPQLSVSRCPDFNDVETHRQIRDCQSTQVCGGGLAEPKLLGIVDCPGRVDGLVWSLPAGLDFDKAENPSRVAHHQIQFADTMRRLVVSAK